MFLLSHKCAFLLIIVGLFTTIHLAGANTEQLHCYVGAVTGESKMCEPSENSCRVDTENKVFKCSTGSSPSLDDNGECVCIVKNCNVNHEACKVSAQKSLDGDGNEDGPPMNTTTTAKPSGAAMMSYQKYVYILPVLVPLSCSNIFRLN